MTGDWISCVFFSVILGLFIIITAESMFQKKPAGTIEPSVAEAHREVTERARIIREVLKQGHLELTPGRHYRVLEGEES